LIEIESEDTTGDGKGNPSKSHDPNDIILAYDGIKLGTRHLQEAYRGGVATVVTAPMSSNVVLGVSVAFKTLSDSRKYAVRMFIFQVIINFLLYSIRK
jgi:hypothetical protein